MNKIICLFLLISFFTYQVDAASWSGSSRTYGNTTYHNFHSNDITVLPANHNCCNRDNTAAYVGAAAIGVCIGALLVKAFESICCSSGNDYERYRSAIDYYLRDYTYENHDHYINVIYYSNLPYSVKQSVIESMDYYYKINYCNQFCSGTCEN